MVFSNIIFDPFELELRAAARDPADGLRGRPGGTATHCRGRRPRGAAIRRRQGGSAPAPYRWWCCVRAQPLRTICGGAAAPAVVLTLYFQI